MKIRLLLIAVSSAALSAGVLAQSTIEAWPESGTRSAAAQPSAGDSQATELFHQLQVLQTEIQELRGLVEEQAHQIERLTREQKEQYLDVDRRLSALTGGGGGGVATARPSSPASGTGSAARPPTGATASAAKPKTEKEAYNQAFALTRERRFQDAIDGFNAMIVEFPNGPYTPNGFYWLGELYLAVPEPALEKSRQSFAQVVNLYPTHQKVPDALYKLGVVYHRLGDVNRANEYLDRVQAEFPNSPAARLARSYAAEIR